MINDFLVGSKSIIKSGKSLKDSFLTILETYQSEIFTISISSIAFNLLVLLILRKLYILSRGNLEDYLEKNDLNHFSLREITAVFTFGVLLTLITYIKMIPKFITDIIAEGGDPWNHFARLKESKLILEDSSRSYFHWDTIFFPDGISAFDADITFYIDGIHFLLSSFLPSNIIYNLIMASSFLMLFLFTYLLSKEISRNTFTSIFSAYLVTFSAFHVQSSLLHLTLANAQFIPLFFFFLLRLLKTEQKLYYLFSSLSLTLIGSSSLIFYLFSLIILGFLVLFSRKYFLNLKNIFKLIIPLFFSLGVLSPWVFRSLSSSEGLKKYFYFPHTMSIDIIESLVPQEINFSSLILGLNIENESYYLGIIFISAFLLSLSSKKRSPGILLGALISLIFCLGNFVSIAGVTLPVLNLEIILSFLPVFKSLRGCDRYSIFLIFFMALHIGHVLKNIRLGSLSYILFVFIFLDIHPIIPTNKFISYSTPKIYNHLPKDKSPILEIPIAYQQYHFWQSFHHHPIVYGYVWTRGPKKQFMFDLLEKVYQGKKISLKLIKQKGIKYIVFHRDWIEPVQDLPPRIKSTIKPFKAERLNFYFKTSEIDDLTLIKESEGSLLFKIN